MTLSREWFWLKMTVPNISQAVDVYVNRWKLFKVINWFHHPRDETAILEAIAPATNPFFFRLQFLLEGSRDAKGNLITGGKNVSFSFPKSDLWEWANEVFGNEEMIKETPWAASVTLNDPFGNVCGVHAKYI